MRHLFGSSVYLDRTFSVSFSNGQSKGESQYAFFPNQGGIENNAFVAALIYFSMFN